MPAQQKYAAFLRGINVGGHHKVPMAELRQEFESLGFTNIKTLLNSGNVVFEGISEKTELLEKKISTQLEKTFGFPIPILIRTSDNIHTIIEHDPFKNIEVHKTIRLYITFLKDIPPETPPLPYVSPDSSYKIIELLDHAVCSVLDLTNTKTPDAMNVLGKFFGDDITTRNWNTIIKVWDKF